MREAKHGEICKPSRGEIETLCVLHAVGSSGCPERDLAARLGLSATLAGAVAVGMDRLITAGLLERVEERFSLTAAGRNKLRTRLAELVLA